MSASAMLLSVRGGLCGPSCVRYIRAVEGGERMSAVRGGGEGGELRGYVEAPVSLHLSHIHTHRHTHTHDDNTSYILSGMFSFTGYHGAAIEI